VQTRKVGSADISQEVALAGVLVCPNCGDTKFGSTTLADGSLIRTCHGRENDETVCSFKWPASDDHKYFHVPLQLVLRLKGDI
jgi:hypothetical protein